MIDRICISINNRCNLKCSYCHFCQKGNIEQKDMDVFEILDNVISYAKHDFKIGFVGNGEPFLDWVALKSYIKYLEDYQNIRVYTITNGTVGLADQEWTFLEKHKVNVGFSLDGYKELHDKNRCESFDKVLENVECYKKVTGHYPTFNATVGKETLLNSRRVIGFFEKFGTRVTFSRMIGKEAISLKEYHDFLNEAEKVIPIRRGNIDCTMYGGLCGAGLNNFFFANGKVYYCGNCIDLPPIGNSSLSLDVLEQRSLDFKRNRCYKESLCE